MFEPNVFVGISGSWKAYLAPLSLFQGQVSKIESTITQVNIITLWNLYPPSIKPSQWSDIGSMHFFLFLFILREIRVFLTDWPISRGRGKVGTTDFFLHLVFLLPLSPFGGAMRDKRFSDRWVVLLRFSISPELVMVRSPLSTSSPWNGVNLEKRSNNALFLDFSFCTLCFQVQFSRCLSSPSPKNESKPGEDATLASLSL